MTATAARISAYSAIVWPRTNPSAFTKYFLTKSISRPHLTNCVLDRLPGRSWTGGGSSPPPGLEIRPMLELELGVHGAEQRGDSRAHLLVGNEHDDGDGRHDQRVLSHRLAVLALGHLYKQFRQLIHFPCPSVRLSFTDQPMPGGPILPSPFVTLQIVGKYSP